MLVGHVIDVWSSHLLQQPSLQELHSHCHLYDQTFKTCDTMARKYTLVAPGRCVYPDKGSVELNELPIFTVYRLVLQQVLLCLDVKADHFVQLQMHPAS